MLLQFKTLHDYNVGKSKIEFHKLLAFIVISIFKWRLHPISLTFDIEK